MSSHPFPNSSFAVFRDTSWLTERLEHATEIAGLRCWPSISDFDFSFRSRSWQRSFMHKTTWILIQTLFATSITGLFRFAGRIGKSLLKGEKRWDRVFRFSTFFRIEVWASERPFPSPEPKVPLYQRGLCRRMHRTCRLRETVGSGARALPRTAVNGDAVSREIDLNGEKTLKTCVRLKTIVIYSSSFVSKFNNFFSVKYYFTGFILTLSSVTWEVSGYWTISSSFSLPPRKKFTKAEGEKTGIDQEMKWSNVWKAARKFKSYIFADRVWNNETDWRYYCSW